MRGAKVTLYIALGFAMVLLLPPALRADTITLDITAYIDGRDLLIVRGSTLQWIHLDFAAVGRIGGANVPTTISTTLNGTVVMDNFQWTPDWPLPPPNEIRFPAVSSVFTGLTPALPSTGVRATLTPIQARGSVGLLPGPPDGTGTLAVDFNDDPEPGPAFYTVQLTISPIPEPSTLGLLVLGSLGIAACQRRRERVANSE